MNSILISWARRRSAALSRPVIQPVRRPAVCARVSPWPSCASKVLISRAVPSGCESRVTLPFVIVPSTSMRSSLICAARFLSAGEILETLAKEASEGKVRESLGYYVNSVATCYSHFPAGDVFILCVNVWRYFHRMGPPSLTLRGHGQSKLLFLLTCHSHVMSQPTKEREGEAGGEEEEEEEKK